MYTVAHGLLKLDDPFIGVHMGYAEKWLSPKSLFKEICSSPKSHFKKIGQAPSHLFRKLSATF